MSIENRRQFRRITFQAPASLKAAGQVWPVKIEDLSLNGALVSGKYITQIKAAGTVALRIQLSDDVSIEMRGEVVYAEGDKAGIQCQQIDLDSVGHLRRLLELNLGNAALLEREFRTLVDNLKL